MLLGGRVFPGVGHQMRLKKSGRVPGAVFQPLFAPGATPVLRKGQDLQTSLSAFLGGHVRRFHRRLAAGPTLETRYQVNPTSPSPGPTSQARAFQ